jgi:hypothetical protein
MTLIKIANACEGSFQGTGLVHDQIKICGRDVLISRQDPSYTTGDQTHRGTMAFSLLEMHMGLLKFSLEHKCFDQYFHKISKHR